MSPRILPLLMTLIALALPAQAAGTLAPVDSGDAPLEILDHHVDVVIHDGFARVEVSQSFSNPNDHPVEGLYTFPLPREASLSELEIVAGERTLRGEVVARERAERIYEQEREAGADAGLGTRESYQRFEFRVANVPPGASTKVRAVYYQPLEIDTGTGRFLYPLKEGGTDQEAAAFWTRNELVSQRFSARIALRSSWPIDGVRVPGFGDALVSDDALGHKLIEIERAGGSLDQDLVVYYRLAEKLPGRVEMVATRPDPSEPGTFMLTLTPGLDLEPLEEGRDFVFVLDVSGSMQGKLATLSEGVIQAIGHLRPEDRFRVVTFAEDAHDLTRGFVEANQSNVYRYSAGVRQLSVRGGTNVYAGLEEALDGLDADRASSVILITDAVTNTGVVDPRAFHELMKEADVRVFGFLLGNSTNWPLMEVICHSSGGFYASVSDADDILGQVLLAKSKVTHEALHDVSLRIEGPGISELTDASTGKVYRGQQLVLFGRYEQGGAAEVVLTGKLTGQERTWRTSFVFPDESDAYPELERLWAMRRITGFERLARAGVIDEGEARSMIRELSVEQQIVTDESAMLVLEDEAFERHGIERKNRERSARERAAQARRAQQAAVNRRVDGSQPMFSKPAPSSTGAGAIHPAAALVVLPLALFAARRLRRLGLLG